MPDPITGLIAANAGGSLVSGIMGSNDAKNAADAQSQSAQMGVEEQRRQFDLTQKNLQPYIQAGGLGLSNQQNMIGLNGSAAQQQAIDSIRNGGLFNELNRQGQEAILQNAAATGGLRGGNVQGALAQFSPQLLQSLIDQQYSRLGGFSELGQNSAAMQGNIGQNSANSISNLFTQQGAAQASGYLGAASARNQAINQISTNAGKFASNGVFGESIANSFKGF